MQEIPTQAIIFPVLSARLNPTCSRPCGTLEMHSKVRKKANATFRSAWYLSRIIEKCLLRCVCQFARFYYSTFLFPFAIIKFLCVPLPLTTTPKYHCSLLFGRGLTLPLQSSIQKSAFQHPQSFFNPTPPLHAGIDTAGVGTTSGQHRVSCLNILFYTIAKQTDKTMPLLS